MILKGGQKRYCADIKDHINTIDFKINDDLGLDNNSIYGIIESFNLELFIESFPGRGGISGFSTIIWWGSVLNDILGKNNNEILEIAGIFNLGIAFFDSIIDDFPEKEKKTLACIAIEIIDSPEIVSTDFVSKYEVSKEVLLLSDIINRVLSYLRIKYSQRQHRFLLSMLKIMLSSEIGTYSNMHIAKQFPILFIGALNPNYYCNTNHRLLFRYLGELINYWDDWKDIKSDMFNLSPNLYLNKNQANKKTSIINGFYYSLGIKNVNQIASNLILNKIYDITKVARQLKPEIYNNTITFLNYLFLDNPIDF